MAGRSVQDQRFRQAFRHSSRPRHRHCGSCALIVDVGFRGAGANSSFLQPFEVVSTKADAEKSSLTLQVKQDKQDYKYGDFFSFRGGVDADVQGPIVFVGYGISSPSQNYDDYSGVDVKGKLVLVAGGSPEGFGSR